MVAAQLLSCALIAVVAFQPAISTSDWHPHKGPTGQIKKLVLPPGQTVERLREKHGMTDEEFEEVHKNVVLIKTIIYEMQHNKKLNESMVAELDEFLDDTIPNAEQSRYMVDLLTRSKKSRRRRKRNLIDFRRYPGNRWKSDVNSSVVVVPFKFDGTHGAADQATIEEGLAHWETHTCVRFRELGASEVYNDCYILFASENTGCWSYVGRQPGIIPQTVNLQSTGCVSDIATTVHEIGHALGFYHEQSRPDRDDYVTVIESNVLNTQLHNFDKKANDVVELHGTKYDLSSVMHYARRYFSTDRANLDTLVTKDSLYLAVIGQRIGLSFLDSKIANIEYCADNCPELPCLNDGYVDPNNCSICKCPDGYGGDLCCEVAASDTACPMENAGSDDVIQVTSDVEQCFSLTQYTDGTKCNWKLKAESGCNIQMYFGPSHGFLVPCSNSNTAPTCLHWVEIKYKGNLTEVGPRFCCETRPTTILTSEGNEAVVTFRSDIPAHSSWRGLSTDIGFQLCYKLDDAQCLLSTSSTTPTTCPTIPSSTTADTTTQPLVETTTIPTLSDTATSSSEAPVTTATDASTIDSSSNSASATQGSTSPETTTITTSSDITPSTSEALTTSATDVTEKVLSTSATTTPDSTTIQTSNDATLSSSESLATTTGVTAVDPSSTSAPGTTTIPASNDTTPTTSEAPSSTATDVTAIDPSSTSAPDVTTLSASNDTTPTTSEASTSTSATDVTAIDHSATTAPDTTTIPALNDTTPTTSEALSTEIDLSSSSAITAPDVSATTPTLNDTTHTTSKAPSTTAPDVTEIDFSSTSATTAPDVTTIPASNNTTPTTREASASTSATDVTAIDHSATTAPDTTTIPALNDTTPTTSEAPSTTATDVTEIYPSSTSATTAPDISTTIPTLNDTTPTTSVASTSTSATDATAIVTSSTSVVSTPDNTTQPSPTAATPTSTVILSSVDTSSISTSAIATPSITPTDATTTATTSVTPTPTSPTPTASVVLPEPTIKKPLTKQEKAELTRGRNRIPVRYRKGGVKMCGEMYYFS